MLLQFAGNKRNDPKHGDDRPGIRVARGLGALDAVWVLTNADDPTSVHHGEALAEALGKGRRGAVRVHQRALATGGEEGVRRREGVREGITSFVEQLRQSEMGARFASAEFVVSLATGSTAQMATLLQALDRVGARVAVAWTREGLPVATWRPAPEVPASEPALARLGRASVAWNVLLTGPTGAGKSDAARRLHQQWSTHAKRAGELVAVNVAALPAALIASELFGHARGAFTGAESARVGAFVRAHRGTLFLDEIGDLPLELQVQLLTVLDADPDRLRVVRAVGSDRDQRVDVRMIFGTNRDLYAMADAGTFRVDLLGRISTHRVDLPGLAAARQRIVPAYVRQLEYLARHHRIEPFSFEPAAWQRLLDFAFSTESAWRWNHRDVIQSAERLALRARDRVPTASRVTIVAAHVEEETTELRARWGAAPTRAPGDDLVSWSVARSRLTPARWEALSHVERWELSYLLAARDATTSNAEAWRWIAERNLLPGSQESVTNPSNAFDKRWRRYRDLVSG